MSVVEAVTEELEALGVDGSALAAIALAMAREMDDVHAEQECEECGHVQSWTGHSNSATSKSMCAKVLGDTMEKIHAAAPPKKQEDRVDEIAKRRERRVARAAG